MLMWFDNYGSVERLSERINGAVTLSRADTFAI